MRGGAHPHPPAGGHSDTPPPSYRAGRLARVTGELVTLVTQLSPRGKASVGGGGVGFRNVFFSLFFVPSYVLPVDIMLF